MHCQSRAVHGEQDIQKRRPMWLPLNTQKYISICTHEHASLHSEQELHMKTSKKNLKAVFFLKYNFDFTTISPNIFIHNSTLYLIYLK